jgi:DMSO/TMAO reductase YedYZ molybdopterin-dependent catalytic subunit
MKRREILAGLGGAVVAARSLHAAEQPVWLSPQLPEGTREEAGLETLPGKQPLIRLADRPPNYEAPIETFRTAITPSDQFFVRYHLAGIPAMDALGTWSLTVGGQVDRQVTFSLKELNSQFEQVEIAAVCQCSGNRRGLSSPHVAGVEWGYGAMGCAIWRGPRLKDVLAKAGVKSDAVEVWLDGADGPVLPTTPDFHKSLPMAKAMADEVIVATTMNDGQLPHLNGYPARIVVPGWTATYWMKHVSSIEVSSKPLGNFWMQKAYRVPAGMFPVDQPYPTQDNATTWPITEMVVNSLVADPIDGTQQPADGFTVRGVAWDRGHGIRLVEVSLDGGQTWKPAELGKDLGRYAFRGFTFQTGKLGPGNYVVSSRATNNAGETQVEKLKFNPAGYHNNVPQQITVSVG